ncbi:hypothetical protein FRB99_006452 [Tulasnella sp. 403]|nr:hypothetical protein FRB99_006452 [Tulasnella sp. 403]
MASHNEPSQTYLAPQYPPPAHSHKSQDTFNTPPHTTDAPIGMQKYGKWNIRIRMMLSLVLPTYLETLDYTVVATAQPHIASSFNRLDLQSWIGISYVLSSTIFLPIYASIADILGRHWAAQFSLAMFIIGSTLCTAAQNMPMLLVGRGISGIGAAGFVSVVRIILSDSASLSEDSFMSSMLVVLYAVGYSTGPVIGGALATVNFRWIFAINLPTSVLSSVLIALLLRPILRPAQPSQRLRYLTGNLNSPPAKETPLQKIQRIDWVGTLIFIGGGILVLLALSLGSSVEKKGFKAPIVIVCFAVGFFLIFLLIGWEMLLGRYVKAAVDEAEGRPRRYPSFVYSCPKWFQLTDPMMPLDIFKSYDVCATSFAAMTGGMVLFSCFYFLAIYFSIVKGLSATKAGIQLLYFSPGIGIGVIIAMRLIKIFLQPKYPAILGSCVISVGIGLITQALHTDSQTQLSGFLALTGAGIGLTFAPLALQARFSQPFSRTALVVSMNLFFRTAGGTIGLAQLSAILDSKVRGYITALVAQPVDAPGALTPAQRMELNGLFGQSLNSIQGIYSLDPATLTVVQDAFRRACRWSFISLIPWCCVAAILLFFLTTLPYEIVSKGWKGTADSAAKPVADDEEKVESAQASQAQARPQQQPLQQQEYVPPRPRPWETVPTPRGPITLIIWPIRVLFAAIFNRG